MNTVNILSRFQESPGRDHWNAGKHLLRYLKGTMDLKLCFYRESNSDGLYGAADADWSGDLNDRKSTTGYYFKFPGHSGAVSWSVQKQSTVALSSSEAEYQSMAEAVQEAIYLRSLLKEVGFSQNKPTTIYKNNQSCIAMCKNPVMQKRTKHVETKMHFIREQVEDKSVSIIYKPTEDMPADLLTKPLMRIKVEKHRVELLGKSNQD